MINLTTWRLTGIGAIMLTAACGGSGGGTSGTVSVVEVTDPAYPLLSDRAAVGGPTTVTDALLLNGASQSVSSGDFDQSTGMIDTGHLAGLSVDDSAFTNPADGEYSRIVETSGANSYFGAVGFGTASADRPTSGTVTTYVQGWTGLTATLDNGTYALTGDATFNARWGDNRLSGTFSDLDGTVSGTSGIDTAVGNVGTITLTDSVISGGSFSGGQVSGTGIFGPLDGNSTTTGTGGAFFGPQADELGGVLVISDDDVEVIGAFQAD